MENCLQETVKVEIEAGDYIFNASGYTVKFDGFTAFVYEESKDEGKDDSLLLFPSS